MEHLQIIQLACAICEKANVVMASNVDALQTSVVAFHDANSVDSLLW